MLMELDVVAFGGYLEAQREQVAMWPHGPKRISRLLSVQTMHSNRDSDSFKVEVVGDWLN